MNKRLRAEAAMENLSFVDWLLRQIKHLQQQTGMARTIFAACPNSMAVIRASLRSAKRNNAPIKFAATLNQVDLDGGYTGLTPAAFVKTVHQEANAINFKGPVIVAVDHGGPWLKDVHNQQKWSYAETLNAVKKSFEAAIAAGYDLIHIDPTIDITLPKGETINIDVVAQRSVDLIVHTETFRRQNNYPRIAYEVGTEEVHGGLADLKTFRRFLDALKKGLSEHGLADVWPCFVVGKVGTDLHTTTFDPDVAAQLVKIAAEYGSFIKGHYTDNVENPEAYPAFGMGAANVGPEFTECEYEGLEELCELEDRLHKKDKIAKTSNLKHILWETVIASGRWKKWLLDGEAADNFYRNSLHRQVWLIKTGCRYIWENPEVLAARYKLFSNLQMNGVNAEEIMLSRIEKSMDKYFHKFNLVDLNAFINVKEPERITP